jgi:hypothetical protein
MDLKKHLTLLKDLLRPHGPFWTEEILNFYPRTLNNYPDVWINSLDQLSQGQLWAFDNKTDYSSLPANGLPELCQSLHKLTSTLENKTVTETQTSLPPKAFVKVKRKKKHEIIQVDSIVEKIFNETKEFTHAIDVGGGIGHLSRILSSYRNIPLTSIDRDFELQKRGQLRRTSSQGKEKKNNISFFCHEMNENSYQNEQIKTTFHSHAFCLGLHTCGRLANDLIKTTALCKAVGLFNFGCCYLKLNPQKDLHLSSFDKTTGPLPLTLHALTLATRSHQQISFEDFLLKERVKNYRYALHLFIYDELKIKKFIGVGEYPVKKYWEPFPLYALEKLEELGLKKPHLSEKKLNDFHQNKDVQRKIRKMFLANIIRWQFGKAIEHYILTDRCLYLEEKGFTVEMAEFFDPALSPRNIGILARNGF